jgi:hypothetical protein
MCKQEHEKKKATPDSFILENKFFIYPETMGSSAERCIGWIGGWRNGCMLFTSDGDKGKRNLQDHRFKGGIEVCFVGTSLLHYVLRIDVCLDSCSTLIDVCLSDFGVLFLVGP